MMTELAEEDHSNDQAIIPTNEPLAGAKGEPEAISKSADFVNQGLLRWEAARAIWLKNASGSSSTGRKTAKPLDVDEIIDLIFSQRWRTHQGNDKANFPEPVPLPQMVDILVDLWEAEGLDI